MFKASPAAVCAQSAMASRWFKWSSSNTASNSCLLVGSLTRSIMTRKSLSTIWPFFLTLSLLIPYRIFASCFNWRMYWYWKKPTTSSLVKSVRVVNSLIVSCILSFVCPNTYLFTKYSGSFTLSSISVIFFRTAASASISAPAAILKVLDSSFSFPTKSSYVFCTSLLSTNIWSKSFAKPFTSPASNKRIWVPSTVPSDFITGICNASSISRMSFARLKPITFSGAL